MPHLIADASGAHSQGILVYTETVSIVLELTARRPNPHVVNADPVFRAALDHFLAGVPRSAGPWWKFW